MPEFSLSITFVSVKNEKYRKVLFNYLIITYDITSEKETKKMAER